MAGNSKACFTVLSYEENMNFFNTSIEKEFDYWYSQKASGIAVGMHHREVDDKNHDHWMIGWSKCAPTTSDFVKLLKARNDELIASAKASGKDVTITLDDGSTVERQFYKIYTGRYANKHCVLKPEALNDYLSHSTKKAQEENKVQYDPDKDVIYSDGFDLESYISRDAAAKAKKEDQLDDVHLMLDLFKMVRETGITNIIDLALYSEKIGRMDLVSYMHAHSATIHFAIADEYRDIQNGKTSYDKVQECKDKYPDGTNSEDEKPYRPEPESVKKTYSESQEILRRSTDEVFGVQSSDEVSEPSVETTPASAEETPASDEAGLSGISTATSGDTSLPVDSSDSGLFTKHEVLMLDPSVRASLTKGLTEDDFEEFETADIAGLFDD